MWLLKLLLIIVFLCIFYQDYQDREVYWFLYPILGLVVLILQIEQVGFGTSILNVSFNLIFILFLLLICMFYSKYKLKVELKDTLGLGDILFFIFIAFSFSMVSFFILFVFSLLFSLILHLFLKKYHNENTVPLAGYMSLFFCTIYVVDFFLESNYLYAY